jgi:hypothetical protein
MRKSAAIAANYARQLDAICSAAEAAAELGLSAERVLQFCRAGRLAAKRIGRDWAISWQAVLDLAELERPTGRRLQPPEIISKKIPNKRR